MNIQHANILDQTDLDIVFIPVNRKGVMGAGLAKEFRQRFFSLCRDYIIACHTDEMAQGSVITPDFGTGITYVFFPTKNHWRNKSHARSILKELTRLFHKQQQAWNGLRIGMVPLGCGLGGLNPSVMLPELQRIADMYKMDVTFYMQ